MEALRLIVGYFLVAFPPLRDGGYYHFRVDIRYFADFVCDSGIICNIL